MQNEDESGAGGRLGQWSPQNTEKRFCLIYSTAVATIIIVGRASRFERIERCLEDELDDVLRIDMEF